MRRKHIYGTDLFVWLLTKTFRSYTWHKTPRGFVPGGHLVVNLEGNRKTIIFVEGDEFFEVFVRPGVFLNIYDGFISFYVDGFFRDGGDRFRQVDSLDAFALKGVLL